VTKIAIIPARGGSKRIPRKNIRPFLGKPILAYSIEAALNSGLFDEVMVSTDDEEIAEIALKHGARAPFLRSAVNADDYAPTLAVIQEVLNRYLPLKFSAGCCIYPTAPFVKPAHLEAGYRLLTEQNYDVVLPIVRFSYPIWRALSRNDQGQAHMIWPEHKNSRSQDLPAAYHDAGQWYWFNPARLKESLFTSHTGAIVLEEDEVQDIDTPTDWTLAELKYQRLHSSDYGTR
jgi:N-acylneuraminate cytidylyltransferase